MSRTLDGATQLVKHPEEAPGVAGALVAADSVEVIDALEGRDDQPGLLRLQWTTDRHVLLRREWCPFTRSEQVRASALLRLSAAIARMSGSDEQTGWIERVKGGTVWIRLARPEDAEHVAQMHERSSERTKYLRYFSNVEWRDLQLRRLSGGHRGATLVAMSSDGQIIGLGNVFPEGPPEEQTAEIAVMVEDAFQGSGIGRALMKRMLEVAEQLGFEHVAASMIAENTGIKKLLESTGLQWRASVSDGISHWTADLPLSQE
jgi:L-amino acid N-acyltransferase YncA